MSDEEKLKELCEVVIEASSSWTGEDEEKSPALKKARTLAGLYKENPEWLKDTGEQG